MHLGQCELLKILYKHSDDLSVFCSIIVSCKFVHSLKQFQQFCSKTWMVLKMFFLLLIKWVLSYDSFLYVSFFSLMNSYYKFIAMNILANGPSM